MSQVAKRVIVELDTTDIDTALNLVGLLSSKVFGFQLPFAFFTEQYTQLATTHFGLNRLTKIMTLTKALKGRVLLDLKSHDDAKRIAATIESVQALQPWGISIHAATGLEAIQAAVQARGNAQIFVVPLLPSIGKPETMSVHGEEPSTLVQSHAAQAAKAYIQGIISPCSEVGQLRQQTALSSMTFICSDVFPRWAWEDRPEYAATPQEAIAADATYIIMPASGLGDEPRSTLALIDLELGE